MWVPLHFDCQRMKNASVGRCTCWPEGEGRPRPTLGGGESGEGLTPIPARPGSEETEKFAQRKVKGSGMERVALAGGPLPMNDQKRSILVAGEWIRVKKHTEK